MTEPGEAAVLEGPAGVGTVRPWDRRPVRVAAIAVVAVVALIGQPGTPMQMQR